jgi:phosphoglycolate phosphatase-like HAD superfamily hydrolase
VIGMCHDRQVEVATVTELLTTSDHVLLAFDGPLCAAYGGDLTARDVADRLKVLVGSTPPPEVRAAHDPLDVLRYAVSCGPATGRVVEAQLRRLETEAVASAPETPGVATALSRLTQAGYTVTIVGNHSVAAVRAFVVVRDLAAHVRGIAARSGQDTDLLTPDPHLVTMAVRGRGTAPDRCVFIGTTEPDITAAKRAGVRVIAYRTTPGNPSGADAAITSMADLSLAMAKP